MLPTGSFLGRHYITGLDLFDGPAQMGRDSDLPAAIAKAIAPLAIAPNTALYAVIDAAAFPGLREFLEGSGLDHRLLFSDGVSDHMAQAAPYLVKLRDRHSLTRAIFARKGTAIPIWGRNAAILIIAHDEIDKLRAHLRLFTMLRDETGAWLFFRFYAPATLYGLHHRLRDDPDFSQAICGNLIRAILHEIPVRDQMAMLTFQPGDNRSPKPVADAKLRQAAARAVPLVQIQRLSHDVTDIMPRRDTALATLWLNALPSRRYAIARDIWRIGIRDPEAATSIAAITLATGLNIAREPAFYYATRNPFLTGAARARQLIEAYQMVARMKVS